MYMCVCECISRYILIDCAHMKFDSPTTHVNVECVLSRSHAVPASVCVCRKPRIVFDTHAHTHTPIVYRAHPLRSGHFEERERDRLDTIFISQKLNAGIRTTTLPVETLPSPSPTAPPHFVQLCLECATPPRQPTPFHAPV